MTPQRVAQGHLGLDMTNGPSRRSRAARNGTGTGVRAAKSNSGIIIGGRWKIATMGDGLNITVSRNSGKNWRVEAYVSTLAAALSWLVNQEVRDSDLTDLRSAVKRIEELRNQIIGIAAGGN